jgi:ubiquinone/menaquinone biosynthesis C-methylase UbiE
MISGRLVTITRSMTTALPTEGASAPVASRPASPPPLRAWTLSAARWEEGGAVLAATGEPHAVMVSSPPLELNAGIHVFRLTLRLADGAATGITFGLQDEPMRAWLQSVNCAGPGPRSCFVRARVKRGERCRLVIASCRGAGAPAPRVRDVQIEWEVIGSDDDVAPEYWKEEAKRQWNVDHCGHDRGGGHDKGTLEYFESIERDRYGSYAPWMPEAIGFARYGGKKVLEVGGGLGTDLAQFAKAGAIVTDFDLAEGHLELAKRNFAARGLRGEFLLGDAERLSLPDGSFDVVYSFGVIHHTPHTQQVVDQIHRVLKPGGEAIVMVYAKHSWNYWVQVVYRQWWRQKKRRTMSIADVLSAYTECSPSGARPLVKVYTARQCRALFKAFRSVRVRKFQLTPGELPRFLRAIAPAEKWGRLMGWNLLVHATK